MNNPLVQIRKATLTDLKNIRSCAYVAYSKYVNRMDKEPAPMNAEFAAQIENGTVYGLAIMAEDCPDPQLWDATGSARVRRAIARPNLTAQEIRA
jgi:hypothetical protein